MVGYEDLNIQQLDVVQAPIDDDLVVIAGAGTGKTRVIVSRIKRLLAEPNVISSRILAISFSRDTKQELDERLNKSLFQGNDVHDANKVQVSTFNALGLKIINRYRVKAALHPDTTTKTEADITWDLLSFFRTTYNVYLFKQARDDDNSIEVALNAATANNSKDSYLTSIIKHSERQICSGQVTELEPGLSLPPINWQLYAQDFGLIYPKSIAPDLNAQSQHFNNLANMMGWQEHCQYIANAHSFLFRQVWQAMSQNPQFALARHWQNALWLNQGALDLVSNCWEELNRWHNDHDNLGSDHHQFIFMSDRFAFSMQELYAYISKRKESGAMPRIGNDKYEYYSNPNNFRSAWSRAMPCDLPRLREIAPSGLKASLYCPFKKDYDKSLKEAEKEQIMQNLTAMATVVSEEELKVKQVQISMLFDNSPERAELVNIRGPECSCTYCPYFLDWYEILFAIYEQWREDKHYLDFPEQINRCVRLLTDFPDIRLQEQKKIHFLFVDEFQDTNRVQFDLLRLLKTEKSLPPHEQNHLCVVGDDDQSIYGWRGADFRCLKEIHEHLGKAPESLKSLTINYRSHQNILNLANSLIAHNTMRILPKRLLCPAAFNFESYGNEKVGYDIVSPRVNIVGIESFRFEGLAVAQAIEYIHSNFEVPYGDIAVLFRLNHLSANVEFSLLQHNIPYFIKEQSFASRTPVQHALAAIRLALDPHDDVAFILLVSCIMHKQGEKIINSLQEMQFSRAGKQDPDQARCIKSVALDQAYRNSIVFQARDEVLAHAQPKNHKRGHGHAHTSAFSSVHGENKDYSEQPNSFHLGEQGKVAGTLGSAEDFDTATQAHSQSKSKTDLGSYGSVDELFETFVTGSDSAVETNGVKGAKAEKNQSDQNTLDMLNAAFNGSQRNTIRLDTLIERACIDVKHVYMPSLYQVVKELEEDNDGHNLKAKELSLLTTLSPLLEKIDEVQVWLAGGALSIRINEIFNTLGITERYMRHGSEGEDTELSDKNDWDNIQQILTIADMCSLSLAVKRASQAKALAQQVQPSPQWQPSSYGQDTQSLVQPQSGGNEQGTLPQNGVFSAYSQSQILGQGQGQAPYQDQPPYQGQDSQAYDQSHQGQYALDNVDYGRGMPIDSSVLKQDAHDYNEQFNGQEQAVVDEATISYGIDTELATELTNNVVDILDSIATITEQGKSAKLDSESSFNEDFGCEVAAVSNREEAGKLSDFGMVVSAGVSEHDIAYAATAHASYAHTASGMADMSLGSKLREQYKQAKQGDQDEGIKISSSDEGGRQSNVHELETAQGTVYDTALDYAVKTATRDGDSALKGARLMGNAEVDGDKRESITRGHKERGETISEDLEESDSSKVKLLSASDSPSDTKVKANTTAKKQTETKNKSRGKTKAKKAALGDSRETGSRDKDKPKTSVSFSLNLDELEEELKSKDAQAKAKPKAFSQVKEREGSAGKAVFSGGKSKQELQNCEQNRRQESRQESKQELGAVGAQTTHLIVNSAVNSVRNEKYAHSSQGEATSDLVKTLDEAKRLRNEYLEQAKLTDPWIEEDQLKYRTEAVELRHLARNMIFQLDNNCTAPWAEELRMLQAAQTEQLTDKDKVQLLSIHGSKGKEFKAVIVLGCERNYMPYFGAVDDQERMEEERRLAYVAFTRAKRYLLVTFCKSRLSRSDDSEHDTGRSLFVNEAISEWSQMPKEQRPYRETLIKADDFVNYTNVWEGRIDK